MTQKSIKLSSPWIYFLITFGISWLFWVPAALLPMGIDHPLVAVLRILGGFGPPVAGIFLTYRTTDRDGQRDFWRRAIDFKRISPAWYAVIFLGMPLLTILAMLLSKDPSVSTPIVFENTIKLLSNPLSLLPLLLLTLAIGPIPEELGWRGYATDSLQSRFNALTSSLILGVLWPLWHLPLFFMPGTFQYGVGFGTSLFWLMMAGMLPQTILFTWIFNNTQRSTLSAILFHFMINFSGEFFSPDPKARAYQTVLLFLVAMLVVLIWRPKTLTRHAENQKEG